MAKPVNKVLGVFGLGSDEVPVIPAPTISAAPPVPTMPSPDEDARKKARATTLARMYERRGRQSTIMSDVAAGVETLG